MKITFNDDEVFILNPNSKIMERNDSMSFELLIPHTNSEEMQMPLILFSRFIQDKKICNIILENEKDCYSLYNCEITYQTPVDSCSKFIIFVSSYTKGIKTLDLNIIHKVKYKH